MNRESRTAYMFVCALAIFLSAFLLFEVQPVISKAILPWFGGSPAVWSTCMLFFQVVLLGGYAYAHALTRIRSIKWQVLLHCLLLVVAVIVLPIIPSSSWKPADSAYPTWRILVILATHVGLPYFMLSSTGPLVQVWFARRYPGRSPYRLYALSNLGSLLALLAYPFLVEPMLPLGEQGAVWAALFLAFALLSGMLAVMDWSTNKASHDSTLKQKTDSLESTSIVDYLRWIGFPALASVLLLSITNHLCQDVAVVPFLWVAPLSLYLLTFIISFDRPQWYFRRTYAIVGLLGCVALGIILYDFAIDNWLNDNPGIKPWLGAEQTENEVISTYTDDIVIQVSVFLGVLFCLCMLCHGELVRGKPDPKYLTKFYLCLSAGGALGGAFVSLIAPYWFSTYMELQISCVAAGAVSGLVLLASWKSWPLRIVSAIIVTPIMFFVVVSMYKSIYSANLTTERNFYGLLRVSQENDEPEGNLRRLHHGRILHGIQYLEKPSRLEPTSYYVRDSGVGVAIEKMRELRTAQPLNIGVIGLGVGTLAAYGQPGDRVRFYEINPLVPKLAREYFFYLQDSQAEIAIAEGDARISMEREDPQGFDVLVVDAFSGDAIPIHLITREALDVYKRQLKPDGIIAIHISNLHLDLYPVVYFVGQAAEYEAVEIKHYETGESLDASSDWMLLTTNTEFLSDPSIDSFLQDTSPPETQTRLWTDQFSNLYEILKTGSAASKMRKQLVLWISIPLGIAAVFAAFLWLRKKKQATRRNFDA